MDKLAVRQAYEQLQPSQQDKERMLEQILTKHRRTQEGWVLMEKRTKYWKLATMLVAFVLLTAVCFSRMEERNPFLQASDAVMELVEDPYYKANMEWYRYMNEMGPVTQDHNDWEYLRYDCRNQEQRHALDEFSKRHGLELIGQRKEYGTDSFEVFYERVHVSFPFCDEAPIQGDYVGYWYYDEGNWSIDALVPYSGSGAPSHGKLNFCISHLTKERFDSGFWRLGPLENYDFWTYTTNQGETLVMGVNGEKGILIRNAEDTLTYATVEDPAQLDRRVKITQRIMEDFAEYINFSDIA